MVHGMDRHIPLPCSRIFISWWRHQMEIFSALLAICAGNSPVPGEFPAQRPMTRSFDDFFDLRPNKWLSKQSWGWWFEMLSRPLWRHCNVKQCYPCFWDTDVDLGGTDLTLWGLTAWEKHEVADGIMLYGVHVWLLVPRRAAWKGYRWGCSPY